jgi:predicted Fe-Mo cluster-binding NifX family protein
MKIAVSSNGNNLDALIDPRFGRCAYFIVVDTDDMSFEAFKNTNISLGGAGIQSAQLVASKGACVVITGNCGPNAVRTLSAAKVDLIINQNGTVKQAIENYKAGNLQKTEEANVQDHYGMNSSAAEDANQMPGPGMGGGMRPGQGGRSGRGMGRGRGMGIRSSG